VTPRQTPCAGEPDGLEGKARRFALAVRKLLQRPHADLRSLQHAIARHRLEQYEQGATLQYVINFTYEALRASDPKHGYLVSPLAIEARQRHLEQNEELASCAERLAADAESCGGPGSEIIAQYERTARTYRQHAADLKATISRIGRQKNSRKDEHARARRLFVLDLTAHMYRAFKKPHHRAVAAITDLTYPPKTPTTADDIAKIWSRRKTWIRHKT
jgi:hypothetical protein